MLTKSKFARRSALTLATLATVFIALPAVSASAASHEVMTENRFSALAKGKFVTGGMGAMSGTVSARFTADHMKKTICYSVTSRGTTGISALHIHSGVAGVDGGVVVPLDPMKIGLKGKTCIPVASEILASISMDSSKYYLNVHTDKYPKGAVRAQLKKTR